ncbi:Rhodanese-like domain containing protein [Tritrichomonas foetus]|uniref:protein-tyrosine-phosphatase n=1 Tax=Tritrichomonas foetus TaxID=1144522 RepID=A0A1J4JQH2_9EUKA|nr:Rhodanese-like domain containing protein [Tritrichomonas foetus]|eukprot:OHS99484.1 Rhodanese-like domain containing protein [Tritrichomonas foetus]
MQPSCTSSCSGCMSIPIPNLGIDEDGISGEPLVIPVKGPYDQIPLIASNTPFPFIAPETVLKLLRCEISLPRGVTIFVIDCRFHYEFAEGHIHGAQNLLTFRDMVSIFNRLRKFKKAILIFHCELTVDRSVQWAYAFREYDRYCSGMTYPELTYPEIYLMKGGFRKLYKLAGTCDVITGNYFRKDDAFGEYGEAIVRKAKSQYENELRKANAHSKARRGSRTPNAGRSVSQQMFLTPEKLFYFECNCQSDAPR